MDSNRAHVEIRVLHALCEASDSQYAASIIKLIEKGRFDPRQLPVIDSSAYHDSRAFAIDYGIASYLKKWEVGADTVALEAKALSTFKDVETAVRQTNLKFKSRSGIPGAEGIISIARRKIIEILGFRSVDAFPFEEFAASCGWGKGATYSLTAKDAHLDNKILEHRLSVTAEAVPYLEAMLRWDTSWMSARCQAEILGPYSVLPSNWTVVRGGRFTTVAKDVRSRRSIDIQPTANLYLQKGLGLMIRRRLKHFGINLDDQSRNQLLASQAQSLGLATIDLASASDSIASEVVRTLMPPTWFYILDDLRTRTIEFGAEPHRLEKFSAMGNGFTFELESLIFYSICLAVADHGSTATSNTNISVYGDDIIVPQSLSRDIIHALTVFGFKVNEEKSFTSGRFYESCGKHFFDGVDVTPLYQKEGVDSLTSHIRAANRILRWAARVGRGGFLDSVAFDAWRILIDSGTSEFHRLNRKRGKSARRLRGRRHKLRPLPFPRMPYGYEGDGAFIDPGLVLSTDVHGTGYFDEVVERPIKKDANEYALLAISLKNGVVSESPYKGKLSVRGATRLVFTRRRVWRLVDDVPGWFSLTN